MLKSKEKQPADQLRMTKREIAETAIRNAIETGLYQPGQIISQRQIGDDLGLSVTPIREAVIELCSTGIVERHSHQSIKVVEIDQESLSQIFQVRHLLEEKAIALCIPNIDDGLVFRLKEINWRLECLIDEPEPSRINELDRDFHTMVFSASGNDALVWTIDRVKSSFPMYALWREPGRIATSVREHAELIDALEARDRRAAIEAQRAHLARGLEATIAFVRREQGR